MTKAPTDAEITKARDVLARSEAAKAEPAKAALIKLVTSKEFAAVIDQGKEAQSLNPGEVDLAYIVSVMERLRAKHQPA